MIRATVDDAQMARGVGIDTSRISMLIFALGAFLAALGGVIGGAFLGVYPGLDFEMLPIAFAVVIIGGMGSLGGAAIGALLVGLADNFGKALFPGGVLLHALCADGADPRGQADRTVRAGMRLVRLELKMSRDRIKILIVVVVLAAIALIVPHANSFIILLATRALAFSILVMSLDLLLGFTGLASLGQAAYLGIGAYLTAILATRYQIGLGYDFWLVVLLGMLGGAALAAVFGLLAIRATGVYFLMITLALGQCVWGLAYRWNSLTGGDNGINLQHRPQIRHRPRQRRDVLLCGVRLLRCFASGPVHDRALAVRPQPGRHSRARAAHENPRLQYLAAQIYRLHHRRRFRRPFRRAVGAYRRHRQPGERGADHVGRCAADGGPGRRRHAGRRQQSAPASCCSSANISVRWCTGGNTCSAASTCWSFFICRAG